MTKELKIKFDFTHGPVWKDIYDPNTKTLITGISAIDQDAKINELNDAAEKVYSSNLCGSILVNLRNLSGIVFSRAAAKRSVFRLNI